MCKVFGDIYYFILTRFDPIWPAVWPFMKKFFKQNIIVFGRSFHNNIFSTFWDTDEILTIDYLFWLYFGMWKPLSSNISKNMGLRVFLRVFHPPFKTNPTCWWQRSYSQWQFYQIYTDHLMMMMIPWFFRMKPHY